MPSALVLAKSELALITRTLATTTAKLRQTLQQFDDPTWIRLKVSNTLVSLWLLRVDASRLSKLASSISTSIFLISRAASKGTPASTPAAKTFHYFPYLSPELQVMIWTAAARPPPCAHYFATFELVLGGREPWLRYVDDAGLWTACRESRRTINRVYEKASPHAKAVGCVTASNKADEMQCGRLAKFNKDVGRFNKSIHKLRKDLRRGFRRMENMLRDIMADPEHRSTKVIKELLGVEPGWKLGEKEVPVEAVNDLCTKLEWGHLS